MTNPGPTLAETALLEAVLEATHDAVLVVDADGRIVRYNRNFLKLFGLTPQELDSRGMAGILDAVSRQVENSGELIADARDAWRDGTAVTREIVRFRDGRIFHRSAVRHDIGGRAAAHIVSYHDVGDAVRTAAALDQHRAFLEKAQEVAHIGSWVAELDGSGSLGWSAETYRIFGVTPASFPGTSDAFFAFVHPDDRETLSAAARAARDTRAPFDIEHRVVRTDGAVRWVREQAEIVRDEAGHPLRMIGTVQDITDRRGLEEQLRSAQRLEALGRLAGGVAHDLNNALTAIAGYTELALGLLEETHPARPDVQEVRRGAERAESVTRQLLAFSRRQTLAPRVFSLQQSMMQLRPLLERLIGSTIALDLGADPTLPPIHGDAGQIEQAIVNLATNAKDAMPDGGRLTIRASAVDAGDVFARAHPPLSAGRYIELRVADTGHGMTPEIRGRIFEPFFTTKEFGKGTGLGLAMVYGTVQQSGGAIFVDSEPGRGTTFRLYFPPADRERCAATAPAGAATIFVVEDEAPVRSLVTATLTTEGYQLLTAASGEEAIALAARHDRKIDLLLTDVAMPGMGGIELAGRLIAEYPDLRVVIMSGYADADVTIPGATIIGKPFTPTELLARIREVLAGDA